MSNTVDNTTSTAYNYVNTKDKTVTEKKETDTGAADKAAQRKEQASAMQQARLESMYSNANSLLTGLTDRNETGMDFFFGAGAEMSSLKTMNTARLGIEGRARSLVSEIRMDQLRGLDTSYKREQLSALTENLNVMNKSLDNNIANAVKAPMPGEKNKPSIIDKINSDLDKIQKAEEKKVVEKYGERDNPDTPEVEPSNGDD